MAQSNDPQSGDQQPSEASHGAMDEERHGGFQIQMRPCYDKPGVGFRAGRVPVLIWQWRVMSVDTRATALWLAVDCALHDRFDGLGRSRHPGDYLILTDGATDDEVEQLNTDMQRRRHGALEIGPPMEEVLEGPPLPGYRADTFYRGDLVVFTRPMPLDGRRSAVSGGAPGIVEAVAADESWFRIRAEDGIVTVAAADRTAVRLGYAQRLDDASPNMADWVYVLTRDSSQATERAISAAFGLVTIISDCESEWFSALWSPRSSTAPG